MEAGRKEERLKKKELRDAQIAKEKEESNRREMEELGKMFGGSGGAQKKECKVVEVLPECEVSRTTQLSEPPFVIELRQKESYENNDYKYYYCTKPYKTLRDNDEDIPISGDYKKNITSDKGIEYIIVEDNGSGSRTKKYVKSLDNDNVDSYNEDVSYSEEYFIPLNKDIYKE